MKSGESVELWAKMRVHAFGEMQWILKPFFGGEIESVSSDGLFFVGGVFAPFKGFDLCLPGKKRDKE